jgi:hypothetical protein
MTALHDLTIKAIRRAQAQGGVIDPVEDWAAIAELDRLARAATEPPPEDKLVFLDLPLIVGNVSLYRLSWNALDWVADCAGVWYAEDDSMYDRALAWAHVNARSPRAFRRCAEKRIASAEISRWVREQTTPWQVITAGVDKLMEELKPKHADESKRSGRKVSKASFLDILLETHGGTIDYWMWDVSMAAMQHFAAAIKYRQDAESVEIRTASGQAPDANSDHARNMIRMQRAAREFVESIVERSRHAMPTDRLHDVGVQHRGMEKTEQMNGDAGGHSQKIISGNRAEKPDGK